MESESRTIGKGPLESLRCCKERYDVPNQLSILCGSPLRFVLAQMCLNDLEGSSVINVTRIIATTLEHLHVHCGV